jgi:hypothetical protein
MATGSGRRGGEEADLNDDDVKAYQEYMLHGAKPKSNKKPPANVPFTSSPERSSSSSRANWKGPPSPSPRQKHVRLLHRSFRASVQAWVETDDQLLQVSRSIANLRDRIWVTSRALTALHEHPQQCAAERGWINQGYRPSAPDLKSPSPLPEHVLQVALSDALVQHEKMLALFRQLMSQLSQDLDAMGRRAEDLFLLHVEEEEEEQLHGWRENRDIVTHSSDGDNRSDGWETDPAQECVELHAACARELYRKQRLAQGLLESTTDAMLHAGIAVNHDGDGDGNDDSSGQGPADERDPARGQSRSTLQHPRSVASVCARTWSRASRSSELFALRGKLVAVETASLH